MSSSAVGTMLNATAKPYTWILPDGKEIITYLVKPPENTQDLRQFARCLKSKDMLWYRTPVRMEGVDVKDMERVKTELAIEIEYEAQLREREAEEAKIAKTATHQQSAENWAQLAANYVATFARDSRHPITQAHIAMYNAQQKLNLIVKEEAKWKEGEELALKKLAESEELIEKLRADVVTLEAKTNDAKVISYQQFQSKYALLEIATEVVSDRKDLVGQMENVSEAIDILNFQILSSKENSLTPENIPEMAAKVESYIERAKNSLDNEAKQILAINPQYVKAHAIQHSSTMSAPYIKRVKDLSDHKAREWLLRNPLHVKAYMLLHAGEEVKELEALRDKLKNQIQLSTRHADLKQAEQAYMAVSRTAKKVNTALSATRARKETAQNELLTQENRFADAVTQQYHQDCRKAALAAASVAPPKVAPKTLQPSSVSSTTGGVSASTLGIKVTQSGLYQPPDASSLSPPPAFTGIDSKETVSSAPRGHGIRVSS